MFTLKNVGLWSLRIKTLKYAQSKRLISSRKKDELNLLMYTAEQQLTVINTLHKCVQNNATRTHLNEKRLQSLKLLFEENPNLTSLEPILNINGFGRKLLHRICDSILQVPEGEVEQKDKESPLDNIKDIKKLRLPSGLLNPALLSQVSIESMVSIKLGINTVSWARLRPFDGQLDSWDLVDISQWAEKKYDVHSVYDLVMSLRENIPDADLYVLENNNWSNVANIKKPMKYHIQEAMLTTAICSVFNLKDSGNEPRTELINRVYFIRSYTPFRLFSKIIGSERVSAEDIVLSMIAGEPDERFSPISFVNNTADRFLNLNGSNRDSMCQALLLVVSFAELIVYKNPTGLSIISKSLKNGKVKKS